MSGGILDTFLNVVVFAYIGGLLWLYFEKTGPED